ncbi:hypothetical protein [Priestia endophytica]|jgi:hypothetical protein|uniref:hypothetical protein n=1 Tax=Priestia endophytica TaxID=135735 RepID=UPI000DCA4F15|nr:hypothetical protein [Priestia endophytica]MCM3538396.1 hypothetical protein [Priestia endophytica]RAS83556.1 hypothetical protein A4R27_05995 [Priestia endophytica]
MYDPTVFDNLKVAFENELYDLDNLEEEITIVSRKDTLEMSIMAKEFRLGFQLSDEHAVTAEVCLYASLQDLASEILEEPNSNPSCTLRLFFYVDIDRNKVEAQCSKIEKGLGDIWTQQNPPKQTLQYQYGREKTIHNTIEINFNRKINENQMEDIPNLIEHMLHSLEMLTDMYKEAL